MFFGLKCFAAECRNCEILLRIDNSTAVSYINRMGGIQLKQFNKLTSEIWKWSENRKLWLFASYIPSKENSEADKLSRITNIDTEWELSQNVYRSVARKFGCPSIDLFASRLNSKCKLYVSWHTDPEAYAIDAFTLSWENLRFYAFPPFALILRVLQKIRVDKATGIVVAPYWPTQPWYPIF